MKLTLLLLLKKEISDEFMADVRKKLSRITGANITIGQPIGHRIDHMLSGTKSKYRHQNFGNDLNKLFTLPMK